MAVLLHGPPNASRVSIYVTDHDNPTGIHHAPSRMGIFDFESYTPEVPRRGQRYPEHVVAMELSASNTNYHEFGASISPPPVVRMLAQDATQTGFTGCPPGSEDLFGSFVNASLEQFLEGGRACEERSSPRFSTRASTPGPTPTISLHAVSYEWAYSNDAPSFSLLRYNRGAVTICEDSTGPYYYITFCVVPEFSHNIGQWVGAREMSQWRTMSVECGDGFLGSILYINT